MIEREPPLPLLPESRGQAPGRQRLVGKKVVVVGGGQRNFESGNSPTGNGRAMSMLFAREGAEVVVGDVSAEAAEATVSEITAEGGLAYAVRCDVRSEEDVRKLFSESEVRLGEIHGVAFNVGIFGGLGHGLSIEDWNNILDVNLRGAMLVGREALAKLSPRGSLVMTSSIAGYRSGSDMIAYDSSKAGLCGIKRFYAREGASRDIRVNTVIPGLVDTPNGREAGASRPSRGTGKGLPFRRQATAWEIAYAALFFLSDESVYITAQEIAVDSGILGM